MRGTALVVLLAAALAPAALALDLPSENPLYNSMWDAGVVVVLYGSQYGTGWWVDRYVLVTAAHVVNYQSRVTVTVMHGDYSSGGEVIYVDRYLDVAVIRVEEAPSYQYVWYLAASAPEKGDDIFVIGYPFELYKITGDVRAMSANPRIATGIVSWTYPDKNLFEFQASTDQGNSGGPVVDRSGNVVGLVSFAVSGTAATMYYGSDVNAIKKALAAAGVNYRVSLGSEVAETVQQNPMLAATVLAVGASVVTTAVIAPLLLRNRRRGTLRPSPMLVIVLLVLVTAALATWYITTTQPQMVQQLSVFVTTAGFLFMLLAYVGVISRGGRSGEA